MSAATLTGAPHAHGRERIVGRNTIVAMTAPQKVRSNPESNEGAEDLLRFDSKRS